jgi:hypothetical protein
MHSRRQSVLQAFTTMTTIGYGDISAATLAERSMAIAGMILANFVFSGIMGRMSRVIDKFSDQNKANNARLDEVSLFLRDCHLPKSLQLTLTSFYRKQDLKAYNFGTCVPREHSASTPQLLLPWPWPRCMRMPRCPRTGGVLLVALVCRNQHANQPGNCFH